MKNILYFIVVGLGLLTACKKGTLVENTTYEKLEYADQKYTYLKILNSVIIEKSPKCLIIPINSYFYIKFHKKNKHKKTFTVGEGLIFIVIQLAVIVFNFFSCSP